MNVKNLFKTTMTIILGSLLLVSCERENGGGNKTVIGGETALVGNCLYSDMSAEVLTHRNDLSPVTFSVASPISAADLQKGGTKIIGIRAYIIDGTSLKVFAGTDKDNPERTQEAQIQPNGWQYVLFDTPLEVGSGDMFIGYTATSPYVTVEKATRSSDELYDDGKWQSISDITSNENVLGSPCVFAVQAIMTGGDYSAKTQIDMALDEVSLDKNWTTIGQPVNIKALVRNNGVKGLKNVTVSAIIGSKVEKITIPEELSMGQYKLVEFSGIEAAEQGELNIRIVVSADNDEQPKNNDQYEAIRVYSSAATPKNRILVEHITGTWCINCPEGTSTMKNAIASLENPDKVAWILYHNGDGFSTKEADGVYGHFLTSTTGIPTCAINRTKKNVTGELSLLWDPRRANADVLMSFMDEPALVTLSIDNRTYNPDTRELSLTVSGKSMAQEAYITAIVLQDSIEANQTGMGSNYEHNNIPWTFLTASTGKKLTPDADGNYSVELKKEVAEKLNSYTYNPDKMEVVVIIHGNLKNLAEVYNTDLISLKD